MCYGMLQYDGTFGVTEYLAYRTFGVTEQRSASRVKLAAASRDQQRQHAAVKPTGAVRAERKHSATVVHGIRIHKRL